MVKTIQIKKRGKEIIKNVSPPKIKIFLGISSMTTMAVMTGSLYMTRMTVRHVSVMVCVMTHGEDMTLGETAGKKYKYTVRFYAVLIAISDIVRSNYTLW